MEGRARLDLPAPRSYCLRKLPMKKPHRPAAVRVPEALLKRSFGRNVTGIFLFELIWGLGVPFGLFLSVVPAYLTVLGVSKSLLGFVMSLWTILTPLQLLSGHYFGGGRRVRTTVAFYLGAVGLRLLYDVLAVFVPGMWTPGSLIAMLVLALASYVALLVIGQAIYTGVLTDNIPKRKRGWIFGLRTLGLGVGGVLTGFAASWVLHHWASPVNYRISFLICDSLWFVSCFALFLVRDFVPPRARPRERGFLHSLWGKVRVLVANPNYRIFLFSHLLNAVGTALATFIVPYAKEHLGVPDSRLAFLGIIFLATGATLGLVIGRIADRFGYRVVGFIQSILLLAFFMIALSARSYVAVCVAYGLYSLVNQALSFVLVNMSVELCPSIGPTDLAALGATLVLPFLAIVSPLAGMVIDLTGSYQSVFFIGATVAVIAMLGFGLLVREPRSGRLYEIRQIPMR
jgi:MFS family permease